MVRVLGLAVAVGASSVQLMCQDPRIVTGGNIMGGYVTPNAATSEMSFTASAVEYVYGTAVVFTVSATDRFVSRDAPNGVFLAVQVAFSPSQDASNPDRTGANGEAMGAFHDLSADLVSSGNCASTLFSGEGANASSLFEGGSHFSWTPSHHFWEVGLLATTGPATFSLVWANDPAATETAPNPYVYLQTLTLADGNRVDPSETLPVADGAVRAGDLEQEATDAGGCVVNATRVIAGARHAFKASPVFVQLLPNGVDAQTLAAQRCVACKEGAACLSAKVTCGTEPGVPVVEELWTRSRACEGAADSRRFADDVVCPGPEHWHADGLDLARFAPKLRKDFAQYFPDDATAVAAIAEYKKMLQLVQASPGQAVVPSKLVDLVWHAHILDTAQYQRDTRRLFGHYLHHAPSFGGADETQELGTLQEAMFARYAAMFGGAPEESAAWRAPAADLTGQSGMPENEVWRAQRSPDCCAADCVKPACQSCVGCNAIDCGYMGEPDNAQRPFNATQVPLAPERFAGYAPSSKWRPYSEGGLRATYACVSQPHEQMTLSWSVIGDYIHFKHESRVSDVWYAVGYASPATADMGSGVDYAVTMARGGNYTDYVRDMYKWDAGNGYPCWDVLFECSAGNGTKGTPDLEDVQVTRENGHTTSTWNRKLVNDDPKDYDITDDFVRLLFAFGTEDYFTYHAQNFGECITNLVTGETQFCWWA